MQQVCVTPACYDYGKMCVATKSALSVNMGVCNIFVKLLVRHTHTRMHTHVHTRIHTLTNTHATYLHQLDVVVTGLAVCHDHRPPLPYCSALQVWALQGARAVLLC